jgi:hypothetical protein
MPTLNRQQGRLDPAHVAPKEKPQHQGHQGEGTTDTLNDTSLDQDAIHNGKPELDLASWIALGRNAKPSRTYRQPKSTWKRGAR